jgi:hypothetical protein
MAERKAQGNGQADSVHILVTLVLALLSSFSGSFSLSGKSGPRHLLHKVDLPHHDR